MKKTLSGVLAAAALAVFLIPALAAGMGGRAAAAEGAPAAIYSAAVTQASPSDSSSGNDTDTDTAKAPASGTGWAQSKTGAWYYFKNGVMKKDYWVTDSSNHGFWYHVGADGRMTTGFTYITDKTWGSGWFLLQAADTNGSQGRMLTSWQNTGVAGTGWFTTSGMHKGECTYTRAWGDYNPATGVWSDGQTHR